MSHGNYTHALLALTVVVVLGITLVSYAAPPWAKEGNWVDYVVEGSSKVPNYQGGYTTIKYTILIRVMITGVDDYGFEVKPILRNIRVTPQEYRGEVLNNLRLESEYLTFDTDFSESCEVYVSPKQVPPNGVFDGISSSGAKYRCVYDKGTGWLKEATLSLSSGDVELNQRIRMVGNSFQGSGFSNVIGASPQLSNTLIIWIAVAVIPTVGAVIAALFLLRRRKGR